MIFGYIGYGALWMSFALFHSLLASRPVRRAIIDRIGSAERLVYNLVAVLHLGVVLLGGRLLLAPEPAFDLPIWFGAALVTGVVVGSVGLVVVLLTYDLGRFSGLTQWRSGEADDLVRPTEPLVTNGLHAYVRHPLYTAAIVTLWGGASTPFGLSTAIFGTLYLIIGLRFEERKLLSIYGDAYRSYRQRVLRWSPGSPREVKKLSSARIRSAGNS